MRKISTNLHRRFITGNLRDERNVRRGWRQLGEAVLSQAIANCLMFRAELQIRLNGAQGVAGRDCCRGCVKSGTSSFSIGSASCGMFHFEAPFLPYF
jgi:hypothetical protein